MPPRKRKAEAVAASQGENLGKEVPLRRSTRQKTAAAATKSTSEASDTKKAVGRKTGVEKSKVTKSSRGEASGTVKKGKARTSESTSGRGSRAKRSERAEATKATQPADDDDEAPKKKKRTATTSVEKYTKPPTKNPDAARSTSKSKHQETSKATTETNSAQTHTFHTLTIASSKKDGKPLDCLLSYTIPRSAPLHRALIFTHGAGGGLSAAAMQNLSQGFVSAPDNSDGEGRSGLVMFPGNMNLKARAKGFDTVKGHEVEAGNLRTGDQAGSGSGDNEATQLVYGGRSMGARAAVLASQTDSSIKTLVLSSYPLVSPSGDVRDQILLDIAKDVDVLFISGDGDSMLDLDMLEGVRKKMKAKSWLVTVEGADHGMNVKGKKGKEGTERVGRVAGRVAAQWVEKREGGKRAMRIAWDGEQAEVVSSGWKAE